MQLRIHWGYPPFKTYLIQPFNLFVFKVAIWNGSTNKQVLTQSTIWLLVYYHGDKRSYSWCSHNLVNGIRRNHNKEKFNLNLAFLYMVAYRIIYNDVLQWQKIITSFHCFQSMQVDWYIQIVHRHQLECLYKFVHKQPLNMITVYKYTSSRTNCTHNSRSKRSTVQKYCHRMLDRKHLSMNDLSFVWVCSLVNIK